MWLPLRHFPALHTNENTNPKQDNICEKFAIIVLTVKVTLVLLLPPPLLLPTLLLPTLLPPLLLPPLAASGDGWWL